MWTRAKRVQPTRFGRNEMSAEQSRETEGESFGDNAVLTELLGDDPKVKIVSVLLKTGRDINISRIAEIGGMGRSTVYEHIPTLLELGVVEQTREVGGSPMYQLDENSAVAQKLGELEWLLLDQFAEDVESADEFSNPEE